jgi:recombinational DNA repair protein RecR
MTAPERIERCRFCGLLHDGEVCARCAKRGHYILRDVAYYADGKPLEEPVAFYGPMRVRPRRAPETEDRNAEDRSS